MSESYRAVQWTPFKRRYDLAMVAVLAAFLFTFLAVGFTRFPDVTPEILVLRALGTAAFLMLNLILVIGPLARLDRRWLPVLANRRHLGVTCFLVALAHGLLVIGTYHLGSDVHPLVSVLASDAGPRMTAFPFQAFGFVALLVLLLMAATSHDFWLVQLTAPVWKSLHMLVYLAYGLLVVHVAFGVLQSETHPLYVVALGASVLLVGGLHLFAGLRERVGDRPAFRSRDADGFVDAGPLAHFEDGRARPIYLSGDRVAVVRFGDRVAAISGVCQHQNGPLSEGRYLHGCLTCPWHGYQYRMEDGTSPPPYTEKIPVFRVRLREGHVWVHPKPLPPGTRVEPARITPESSGGGEVADAR